MEEQVFGGRYKVIKKLGAGGMAEVYMAKDGILGRTVAIKVLHSRFAHEANFVERLRREAQAAANLNHPNIVSIFDWGGQDDAYFIVMEYLEGRNLKEIIEQEAPLAPDRVIEISRKVCSALQFAHRHNIIHRDIKPHNIIITSEGEVKVTDFGIAVASSSNLTQTGSIVGTAYYVSPEQAQGKPAQATSDIYSLGIVMYEMLTRQLPFKGDSPVAVAFKQVHEAPVSPRRHNPIIPVRLEKTVMRALSKNSSERYQSAYQMKEDLTSLGKSEGESKDTYLGEREKNYWEDKTIVVTRQQKKEKSSRALIITLFILAALALISGAYIVFNLLFPSIVVPSLKGKTLVEARSELETKGLSVEVVKETYSNVVGAGKIIDQEPQAGEKINEGEKIRVTVSKGGKQIIVPDVVGRTGEEAGFILGQSGLQIGKTERIFSDTVSEGIVIEQDPKANAKVSLDDTVNIVVSKGEEKVEVPDVAGRTSIEAGSIIGQAGLRAQTNEEYSDTVVKDKVINQSPEAGSEVKKDSIVEITISKGPETTVVPYLVGMNEKEAKDVLEKAGLIIDVKYASVGEGENGRVLEQYPEANTEIKKGSTVSVSVKKETS
ncbi:MAG: serine/threonine protein kinase [Actinobacteria bacterium]|nr:serine/threonine protein kinase [Actinomycetota bacterium]